MAVPVQASLIHGPAIITFNGVDYFSQNGYRLTHERRTFNVVTDLNGFIDERLESDIVKISWTPAGEIESFSSYFPYGLAAPIPIGVSIIPASPNVVIKNLGTAADGSAGTTITYDRGAITKMPQLRLRPTETLFGEMEITCIGKATTDRADAAYWKTLASPGTFSHANFDETKIKTAYYSAAFGLSPYDAIGSLNGFTIDTNIDVQEMTSVDLGVVDLVLKSIQVSASFAPNNLTEAQIDTLVAHSNTGALYPGQSVAKAGTDLVITSDAFNVTIKKAGPVTAEREYAAGVHRHRSLTFASKRYTTAGVVQPIMTMS